MKSKTRLESAVFQLTPTRTRFDLIITASDGKAEKIASGLLNPFLSHLKTAQEQIDQGGYSIKLEPESNSGAAWFTKATVERFVRFVSNPEVLERVYTIETEILQIEEAIAIQSKNELGWSPPEDQQTEPVKSIEDSKTVPETNEEKAIVLYEPGAHPPAANGSSVQEGNSKVQLLRVLETRRTVLQKEQGMAFARAVAAGFDIDHMPPLIAFAECFGASRLMEASGRFVDLWKKKHETGQWLEIEAAEAMSSRSEISSVNGSGFMLSQSNKQNEFKDTLLEPGSELATEKTLKRGNDANAGTDEKAPMDHQVPLGHPEYFQGQYLPHPMFHPWPIHSPPGAIPVYQPYPLPGMPYYPNYPVNGQYFHAQNPSTQDSTLSSGQPFGEKRHAMDSDNRDSNNESENWDLDASESRGLKKISGKSGKRKPGTVVIRNINYITKKKQNSSDSESQSVSDSMEDESTDEEMKNKNTSKSKRVEFHNNSVDNSNLYDKEADVGNWQAFQNCLLREDDEDRRLMLSVEKEVKVKRRQNADGISDPLTIGTQDLDEVREGVITEFDKISGKMTHMPRASNDTIVISKVDEGYSGKLNVQFSELEGRRSGYMRKSNDDFIIHGRENQYSTSNPLIVNGFERANNKSSNGPSDESFMVPLRSVSMDHVGVSDGRIAIDMDAEIPSENPSFKVGSQPNYEPRDLSLMPERGMEKGTFSYDPALDYEMQVQDNKTKEAVVDDVKQGSKMTDGDKKGIPGDKKKTAGSMRKGKPSKLSPLDEARARAERIRNFKADLQRAKKEKEEEEMKRLEALKIERQKRIAARGSFVSAQSPQQTKKQFPSKVSPNSQKGSKFSDAEPNSLSPLQSFPKRTSSLESHNKPSKPTNRLSRSVSSLPESEPKKEANFDPKASIARIRRLSEPKQSSNRGSKPMISAIMNLDRNKAASLPEVKIRMPQKRSLNKSGTKEVSRKVNGIRSSATCQSATVNGNSEELPHRSNGDDNTVIEKTVVMLEDEKSLPALEEISKIYYDEKIGGDTEIVLENSAIRTPASPDRKKGIDREVKLNECLLHEEPSHIKVKADSLQKESSPKNLSVDIAEKPYTAPYARISSLEDPCTKNSEYSKAPPTNLDMATTSVVETAKVLSYDFRNMKLEKIPEVLEKPHGKESSKGIRRLLKFGRKNHSECNVSEADAVSGSGEDDKMNDGTSPSEVHSLKNLISQDEIPTAGMSQKSSRPFSILSPFRSKSGEKKVAA